MKLSCSRPKLPEAIRVGTTEAQRTHDASGRGVAPALQYGFYPHCSSEKSGFASDPFFRTPQGKVYDFNGLFTLHL